jgi:hypothetical protein
MFGQLLYGVYGGPAQDSVVGERVQQFDGFRISDCAEHVDDLAGAVFLFGSRKDRRECVPVLDAPLEYLTCFIGEPQDDARDYRPPLLVIGAAGPVKVEQGICRSGQQRAS